MFECAQLHECWRTCQRECEGINCEGIAQIVTVFSQCENPAIGRTHPRSAWIDPLWLECKTPLKHIISYTLFTVILTRLGSSDCFIAYIAFACALEITLFIPGMLKHLRHNWRAPNPKGWVDPKYPSHTHPQLLHKFFSVRTMKSTYDLGESILSTTLVIFSLSPKLRKLRD